MARAAKVQASKAQVVAIAAAKKEAAAAKRAARMAAAEEAQVAKSEAARLVREESALLARDAAARVASLAALRQAEEKRFWEKMAANQREASQQRAAMETQSFRLREEAARRTEQRRRREEDERDAERRQIRAEQEAARQAAAELRRRLEEEQRRKRTRPPPLPPSRIPAPSAALGAQQLPSALVNIVGLPIDALVPHVLRHRECAHRCLGLPPNARPKAVRKQYLCLARRLHPDKSDHPSAAQAFAAIDDAFRSMRY